MKTLSLYEDNAGGLHLLRHSDSLVIHGLETVFANGGSSQGHLLDIDQTEYLRDESEESLLSDGHETGTKSESFFEGLKLVAEFKGNEWAVCPDEMGTNAQIACGTLTDTRA